MQRRNKKKNIIFPARLDQDNIEWKSREVEK